MQPSDHSNPERTGADEHGQARQLVTEPQKSGLFSLKKALTPFVDERTNEAIHRKRMAAIHSSLYQEKGKGGSLA